MRVGRLSVASTPSSLASQPAASASTARSGTSSGGRSARTHRASSTSRDGTPLIVLRALRFDRIAEVLSEGLPNRVEYRRGREAGAGGERRSGGCRPALAPELAAQLQGLAPRGDERSPE